MSNTRFVPLANRITVGDVYGRKVIVGNQNNVRPDEIYAEVDEHTNLTKVVDANRTLVPGGGGTSDYADLENKPKINGTELNGDLSASDLGLATSEQAYLTLELESGTGTLTEEQLALVESDNCVIFYNNEYYYKNYGEGNDIEYICNHVYSTSGGGGIYQEVILIDKTDGSYSLSQYQNSFPQEVFVATYGSTTAQAILNAETSGKICVCDYYDTCYFLNYIDTNFIYFTNARDNIIRYIRIYRANNTWTAGSANLEKTSNKVTSISLSSTDDQYPSAKCVYDALPVFWATYGTTTYQQIVDAYTAGKAVMCLYNGHAYSLTNVIAQYAGFSAYWDKLAYLVKVTNADVWSAETNSLQSTYDRVSSWQSTPDNNHYPSEKLVKDSLDTKIDNTDVEALTAIDVDNTPTVNSSNLVTSGGVYLEVHPTLGTSMPSGGFLPNVEYNLGTLNADTTFLMASATDNNISNIWCWSFKTPSTTLNITFPSSIVWNGGTAPTINTEKYYEIMVKNSVGTFIETDIPT